MIIESVTRSELKRKSLRFDAYWGPPARAGTLNKAKIEISLSNSILFPLFMKHEINKNLNKISIKLFLEFSDLLFYIVMYI